MVIDHINAIWFDLAYFPMFLTGRGTFPLFCYAVAMALLKAKEDMPRKYLLRLSLMALVAQPFFMFALEKNIANVIFALALGAFVAAWSRRCQPWHIYVLSVGAAFSMLWDIPLEFGLAGVMLPALLLLGLQGKKSAYPFILLLLFSVNAAGLLEMLQEGLGPARATALFFSGLACVFLPMAVLDIAGNLRQAGRLLPKYALYIFYPAHLAILKLVSMGF